MLNVDAGRRGAGHGSGECEAASAGGPHRLCRSRRPLTGGPPVYRALCKTSKCLCTVFAPCFWHGGVSRSVACFPINTICRSVDTFPLETGLPSQKLHGGDTSQSWPRPLLSCFLDDESICTCIMHHRSSVRRWRRCRGCWPSWRRGPPLPSAPPSARRRRPPCLQQCVTCLYIRLVAPCLLFPPCQCCSCW